MYTWSLWGMNFIWWFFWLALAVVFFTVAVPVPRRRVRLYDHPLSILRRRYAAGEISTEEYEERRARLIRDLEQPDRPTTLNVPQRREERHA